MIVALVIPLPAAAQTINGSISGTIVDPGIESRRNYLNTPGMNN
jgi:hypothetical protein